MISEKANIKDLSALIELRKAYLLEDYGKLSKEKLATIHDNLKVYFKEHLNSDLYVFVCRDMEDVIVSCCYLLITEKPSNPTFLNGRTGTILNVYTKPEYRRKGIAKKLIEILIAEAEKMQLDFVELKSTDSGYNLYKSVGFEDSVQKYHNMKYIINPNNKI